MILKCIFYNIDNIKDADWDRIENYKLEISKILLEMADLALYQAKKTICKKCKFNSEKNTYFKESKCPNCRSTDLITGRNKVVGFE